MKIAVIGAGNMGGATAVGLAKYYPGEIGKICRNGIQPYP